MLDNFNTKNFSVPSGQNMSQGTECFNASILYITVGHGAIYGAMA